MRGAHALSSDQPCIQQYPEVMRDMLDFGRPPFQLAAACLGVPRPMPNDFQAYRDHLSA